jgi:hypothetical protein
MLGTGELSIDIYTYMRTATSQLSVHAMQMQQAVEEDRE